MALISGSNRVPHSDIKKVAPIKVAPTPPAVVVEEVKPVEATKVVNSKKKKN
jgi:hypothetical protein